jgi:hypothetical protein
LKLTLGPAIPDHFTPCGRPPLKRQPFLVWPLAGWVVCGCFTTFLAIPYRMPLDDVTPAAVTPPSIGVAWGSASIYWGCGSCSIISPPALERTEKLGTTWDNLGQLGTTWDNLGQLGTTSNSEALVSKSAPQGGLL